MMPQPATRSNRQICGGLRFRATPPGRLSSRLVVRLPFDSGPLDQSRNRRDGPIGDIVRGGGALSLATSPSTSLDEFDLAQPPFLREEWFERTVEAQDHPPALAGHRLDPISLLDPSRL